MSQSQKKRQRRALLGDRTIRDSVERLNSYEANCSDAIPRWWEMMDHLRARRVTEANELPGGWPEWCFFPTPELHRMIPSPDKANRVASEMRNGLIARMLGLYAWRQGRTVWHFDPDVATALVETEDMGRVPAEILRRLPQWGVYIQRPDIEWRGDARPPAGVLARLTTPAMFDFEPTGAPVLEVQYDQVGQGGIGLPLSLVPLVPGLSLNEALALVHAKVGIAKTGGVVDGEKLELEHAFLRPWLALLMYLCSQGADTENRSAPSAGPPPTRTPGGGEVTRVDVGFRVGAAIRHSRSAQPTGATTERTVAPHLRRAHFHTFYSGAGSRSDPSKRQVEVRWLPPIAVGVGDVTPVVRPVDDGPPKSRGA